MTFDKFNYYEFFLKLSPDVYYTKVMKDEKRAFWDSMSNEERERTTIYDIILKDNALRDVYIEIFNFFFVENVVYKEGLFILTREKEDDLRKFEDNICGVITSETFPQVVNLMQQICCIYDEEESLDDMKFKNNLARKLAEKMMKAKQNMRESKKLDLDLTIPNIISSISNMHPSLNYVNIWDLTIFQLLDAFNRMQGNLVYEINSARVSVWGDEKKTFDFSLWYKNNYDKK